MRLALLSNVTVDILAGKLKKNHEVYLSAGFDTWQQEMIIPSSGLYDFSPEAVFVLLHANAYQEIWHSRIKGEQVIDEWCGAFKAFLTNRTGIPVFISSVDISNIKCRYGAEVGMEVGLEEYLENKVHELHDINGSIYMLPVRESISEIGRSNFYSSKMWYVGSMPYSIKGISSLEDLIVRYAGVIKGMHKKCLAVDLDNTLWGGVIGEDGVGGIVLANNKEGARYKDTQRILKKMKDQGVMLAILSKNNLEDVEPVFNHPDMVLQHEDFVAEVINWEPKCKNIRNLAANLNIGLDAFVFLDDNPAEREQMKAECPEVAVIEFPNDSSQLPEVVTKAYNDFFLTLEVTGEDVKKTAMYRAENKRKEEMATSTSVEDFLKNLQMTMEIHPMKEDEEKRVVQLTNKTNQFNVTTRRYNEEEIHAFANAGNSDVVTVHTADKYGDQGLVAVLILKYEETTAEIDTFLMSCRVMGRKVEEEILTRIGNLLRSKGIESVKASYIRTAKNAPVSELFEQMGFDKESGDAQEIGERKNYRTATEKLPAPTGIFSRVTEEWS